MMHGLHCCLAFDSAILPAVFSQYKLLSVLPNLLACCFQVALVLIDEVK